MSNLICVFDVGTTGARTIVFDIDGKVIARDYEEYVVSKQPVGISEQDPHIWCSPKNASIMIDNMVEGFIAIDPGHKTEYRQNADSYKQQLELRIKIPVLFSGWR